jgi:hypothetical protein
MKSFEQDIDFAKASSANNVKSNLKLLPQHGIMAIDAGKTTTTERILYYTGKSYKIGEVHDEPQWTGLAGNRGVVSPAYLRSHHLQMERPPH